MTSVKCTSNWSRELRFTVAMQIVGRCSSLTVCMKVTNNSVFLTFIDIAILFAVTAFELTEMMEKICQNMSTIRMTDDR